MKKYLLLPIALFMILAISWWQEPADQLKPSYSQSKKEIQKRTPATQTQVIPKDRPVMGLKENQKIDELPFENEILENWKQNLQTKLQAQAGTDITIMDIQTVKSYIQVHQGRARYLESVIVRMENAQGMPSSFRAEVDSGSGTILKTWDKPIYENFKESHRKQAKIIVDERDYFRP
jgi:hypothetical protein